MPSGPIGSVWALGGWSDTAWEANTWADLVPPVVVPSSTGMLNPGQSFTLGEDVIYTLPAKRVRIAVYTVGGTIQTSEDGTNWQDITLDVNKEFTTVAVFIKVIDSDAIISLKASR
jgi:hypothetical protein